MNIKIGICQNRVQKNKKENFKIISDYIKRLSYNKVDMVILPECWNCPYGVEYFEEYAESISNSESINLLQNLAKKYNIYIIGGSIPIIEEEKIYNTCICFNNSGNIIGIYNKIHLFDINLNNFTFKESTVLTPGEKPLIIDTIFGKIGIGICYDLRFPLLADYYSRNGCKMIIYPGAFSEKTGPLHWTLLLKARAVDNECFIVGCSTGTNNNFKYKGYGHSSVINPWGNILYEADENPIIKVVDINLDQVSEMRKQIPIFDYCKNFFDYNKASTGK